MTGVKPQHDPGVAEDDDGEGDEVLNNVPRYVVVIQTPLMLAMLHFQDERQVDNDGEEVNAEYNESCSARDLV